MLLHLCLHQLHILISEYVKHSDALVGGFYYFLTDLFYVMVSSDMWRHQLSLWRTTADFLKHLVRSFWTVTYVEFGFTSCVQMSRGVDSSFKILSAMSLNLWTGLSVNPLLILLWFTFLCRLGLYFNMPACCWTLQYRTVFLWPFDFIWRLQ